ncbi:MAG: glutamate ligase domain-containing protein, partial [Candidatus Hodarchaeales archaeon]
LGYHLNIPTDIIKKSITNFLGIKRRLECLGKRKGILVYDDYAHHPTAIKETLKALRDKYTKKRIIAIVEPHTYSRTNALLDLYKNVFDNAGKVIITKIYKSRDTHTYGVNEKDIVKFSKHKNIECIISFSRILTSLRKELRKDDIVIVMGAGNSYKLSRDIYEDIKK